MNKEEIKNLLEQTKSRYERLNLLDKITCINPNITITEAMEFGFSYEEIIFG